MADARTRMVRGTEDSRNQPRIAAARTRFVRRAACCLLAVALVAAAGCSSGRTAANAGGAEATAGVIPHGGPAVEVRISQEALRAKPKPWVLDSPENAVRSYLAWTSYAYRIAQSDVATATMTPYEEVVVDSYIQYNVQKGRLIDQRLDALTFGKPSAGTTSTLVPVREKWTYQYLSVETGKLQRGPYKASYDATYTVVKSAGGQWRVEHSVTTPLGEVK